MNGTQLIAEERERQINEEGWTPAHDAAWRAAGPRIMAALRPAA